MYAARAAIFAFFLGTALAQIQVRPFLDLPGETSDPAISPDGKTLAFAWWTPDMNAWGLYTRAMSGGQPRLFDKAEEGISYSPNGRRTGSGSRSYARELRAPWA